MKKPATINPFLEQQELTEFLLQQQKAMENTTVIINKVNETWNKKFRRSCILVEPYMLEDAERALVITGSNASTAKTVVEKLREDGERVGLLRLRILRPFPFEEIEELLKDVKKIAVLDQNISLGSSGILFRELRQCYNGFCMSFISGKNPLSEKDFFEMFRFLKDAEHPERKWVI